MDVNTVLRLSEIVSKSDRVVVMEAVIALMNEDARAEEERIRYGVAGKINVLENAKRRVVIKRACRKVIKQCERDGG